MPAPCSFVLENSGVAEPQNIRDKFNEAYIVGHPVTERVVLDTMVTIVDAGELVCDVRGSLTELLQSQNMSEFLLTRSPDPSRPPLRDWESFDCTALFALRPASAGPIVPHKWGSWS